MKDTSTFNRRGADPKSSSSSARDVPRLDHFFSSSAARLDRWRELNAKRQTWAAESETRQPARNAER